MSGSDVRKVSCEDLQMVQSRIWQCLQLYMSREEVVNNLFVHDNIEPSITELVWQKLEDENQEIFQAYFLKLMVKEQILKFNQLLAEHLKLMHQIGPSAIATLPVSNGSHISPILQNSARHTADNSGITPKLEGMHKSVPTNLPNNYSNRSSSFHPRIQTAVNMPLQKVKVDVNASRLTQTSNVVMTQTMNGKMIKPESVYESGPTFNFGAHGNIFESPPALGDASVSSFSSAESNSHPETLFDADTSSFGFLGPISQNFNLTDYTADFSNSSDILESYSRSPFLATDTGNLLDPSGDIERLANSSDGLRYKGFSSD
ncbi:uncharacterized protein LOC116003838 [Ipomoea triloba]|uniref:uncharacterized protein LOC116003838 n=1 Tax=Ipomoea triloba TaxID=35885 RepID=UPI00125DCCE0|nr:uncharacterized protein LOC116003838 [Ipomoea triloba]XP_031099638.1 uncharacterized protein LOC116003838 [Ipomoea triloba]